MRRRLAIALAICAWAMAAGCRPTVDADAQPGTPDFRPTLRIVGSIPQPGCVESLARWLGSDLTCQQQARGRNLELWEILRRRNSNAEGKPDRQTQLDRALFWALDGKLDQAERALTSLPEQELGHPAVRTELAALHLLTARGGGDRARLRAALALAAEAAESEPGPDLLAVLAAACEAVQLRHEAQDHWRRLAGDPYWGSRAREALRRLEAPTVAARWSQVEPRMLAAVERGDDAGAVAVSEPYPLQTRRWWRATLLSLWAAAAPGSAAEQNRLRALRSFAAHRDRQTGDDAMLSTVSRLATLDPLQRTAIHFGLTAGNEAAAALAEGNDAGFRRAFDGTQAALEQLPEELAALRLEVEVEHQIARVQLRCLGLTENCSQDVGARFQALLDRCQPSWKALRGKLHRQLGVLAVRDAAYGSADREFEFSADLYDQVDEAENRALARAQRAEALQQLGQLDAAWEQLAAALPDLPNSPTAFRRHSLLYWTTDHLRAAGYLPAALLAASEYRHAAFEDRDPTSQVEAALQTSRCLRDRDDPIEALALLEQARQVPGARLAEEPDGRLAVKLELETVLAASFLQDPAHLRATLQRLVPLRTLLEAIQERFDLRQLLVSEGRILRALGQSPTADLEAQLRELIRQWVDLVDEADSLAVLARDRELFNQLAALYLDGGDEQQAWSTLERGRSAALIRRRDGVDPLRATLTYADVRRRLRPGEVLWQFVTGPEQTLVWSFTASRTQLRKAPIGDAALQGLISQLTRALRTGDRERSSEASVRLRLELFGDDIPAPQPSTQLLISPDGALHNLPWSLLFEPALGEPAGPAGPAGPAAITLLPSAHLLVARAPEPLSFDAATPILFVANPALGQAAQERFRDLSGSREIQDQLQELFPNTTVRSGQQATRAVLAELSSYRIVHFDVHGLLSETPATSSLVLAPTDADDGVDYLLAREIAKLDLSTVDLVILAGCDTARGPAAALGESNSLARAFLAAGAKAVIATLWKVDDQAAADLLQDFYRQLAAGEAANTALTAATRTRSASRRPEDADLRAFQLIGL